ncbi:hypothetical protein COO91_07962 [Nostoc flagelliforme CCNUN1]|uniref:Uncharacterized protein n=1 Tax=Nostoc flagelliforme CCNUN1 TaxID=2038116 RepID=A0A2K8T2F7_9NOSO|nr:hypothetical protein COO91_07962 [Nostoc flagelliforme CCNUN1]
MVSSFTIAGREKSGGKRQATGNGRNYPCFVTLGRGKVEIRVS